MEQMEKTGKTEKTKNNEKRESRQMLLRQLCLPILTVGILMGSFRLCWWAAVLPTRTQEESSEEVPDKTKVAAAGVNMVKAGEEIPAADSAQVLLLSRYLTCIMQQYDMGLAELEAVGHMMRNRAAKENGTNTLTDIIFRETCAADGSLFSCTIDEMAQMAAVNAFAGSDITGGALNFSSANEVHPGAVQIGKFLFGVW